MYFILASLYNIYNHACQKPLRKKNIFYFSIFYKAYNIKHEKEETVFSNLTIKQRYILQF